MSLSPLFSVKFHLFLPIKCKKKYVLKLLFISPSRKFSISRYFPVNICFIFIIHSFLPSSIFNLDNLLKFFDNEIISVLIFISSLSTIT